MLVPGLNARWSERSRRRPIASTKYFIRNPRIKKQRTRASIIRCRTLKATYTYNADFPRYPSKINVRRSSRYLFRKRNVSIDGMRCLTVWRPKTSGRSLGASIPRIRGKIAEKLRGRFGRLKYVTCPITGWSKGTLHGDKVPERSGGCGDQRDRFSLRVGNRNRNNSCNELFRPARPSEQRGLKYDLTWLRLRCSCASVNQMEIELPQWSFFETKHIGRWF